jgi:hypothetical protein
VLCSRLPEPNSPGEFAIDKLARLQATDALDTLVRMINLELARRLNEKL